MLRAFTHRWLTGGIGFCSHLHGSAEPSWWSPAKPGRLRCLTCASHATERGPSHRERCDHCRRVRNPLAPGVLLIPPMVIENLAGRAVAVGPIVVIYQLCSGCQIIGDPETPDGGPPR